MTHLPLPSHTAFDGYRLLASGSLQSVALAVKRAAGNPSAGPILIFDNTTGRSIDIDTRGSDDDIAARFASVQPAPADASRAGKGTDPASDTPDMHGGGAGAAHGSNTGGAEPRGRGRPKLGVIAREVTLLPRHWEWLSTQPGGASVALRKLVDEARRIHAQQDRNRQAQERAYHFMSAIAGDLPGFEEAARALFANDADRLHASITSWPDDVRSHTIALAYDREDTSDASHHGA
ncbi:hypothetical protein WS67_05775 [Burkholderia singularis]|uniref:DUF2239 domain-containing protein n=1 Tax=Burkholderia singularis TaxID=1503053 RepID=A0A103E6T3_9BURK|nr:DUF2239 family protein [Burkholderia singularis]KVE29358.1 hypothetical protein WS67_05775 [Burkholderia singularis]